MPRSLSRQIYTGIALLLAASLALPQAYRWVDEDGVVHYSDQPHPGAEEVELERAPAINMPAPRRSMMSMAMAVMAWTIRYMSVIVGSPCRRR